MTNQIQLLEEKITEASERYYNGDSMMPDADFDLMVDELRRIAPESAVLKKVGASAPESGWKKAKHDIPMGSLNKVQSEEEFKNWALQFEGGAASVTFVASEKLDGLSIELKYVDGKLVQAITRGDGEVGEDITSNARQMKGVQEVLPEPVTCSVRGEILLLKSDWKKHFPELKNPRNGAVGISKRLDGFGSWHLSILCYELDIQSEKLSTYAEVFQRLTELNFRTPCIATGLNESEVIGFARETFKARDNINYDIDGVVIRVDNMFQFNGMGVVNGRPKGAIAFKPPPEKKVTVIKEITWQVGSVTGRVTPVAEIDPVDLCGATISRVTLHTAKRAQERGLGVGARVVVSRANDVIPYLEEVLEKVELAIPGSCPECHQPLVLEGEYLSCPWDDCSAKLPGAIGTWTTKLDIKNWGPAFIQLLVGSGLVGKLSDIYALDWAAVAKNAGPGIAERARKELEAHRTVAFATFVSALGIRHCDTTAKDLVSSGIDTVDKLLAVTGGQLLAIEGVGPVKAENIVAGVQKLKGTIVELAAAVTFEKPAVAGGKGSVCFTGKSSKPRKQLSALAEGAGYDVRDSVGAGLHFLVMADANSTSSKAVKARKLGTTCISEEEFVKMTES